MVIKNPFIFRYKAQHLKEDPRKASLSKDEKKNMGSPKKWKTEVASRKEKGEEDRKTRQMERELKRALAERQR